MKNRFLIVISSVALLGTFASACSKQAPVIKLANDHSRLVNSSFTEKDNASSCKLETYHHKKYGDVPYVSLSDFAYAIKTANGQLVSTSLEVQKVSKGLYSLNAHNIVSMYFNSESDVVTVKRDDVLNMDMNPLNNGVGPDFANPTDSEHSCVHTSDSTKYIVEPSDQVYNLKNYNLDLVEQNDNLYLPAQLASAIILKNTPADIIYNGLDFFVSSMIGEDSMFYGANCSFFSNYKEFSLGGYIYKECPAVGEEVYRYGTKKEDGKYDVFSFKKDGTVLHYVLDSLTEEGKEHITIGVDMEYLTKDEGIHVACSMPFFDDKMVLGVFKIPFEKTNFNTKVRSKAVAEYSYNHLRFIFDNLYGLPEDLHQKEKVQNIDELIESKGLKAGLLETDSLKYDDTLATLTMTYVDDCHTKYVQPSVYSGFDVKGSDLCVKHYGPRRQRLATLLDQYKALRTTEMTKVDPKYSDASLQQGLFMEDSTAVVRFDAFLAESIIISNNTTVDTSVENIPMLMRRSTPDGFYSAFKNIEKNNDIKNVVLDLTVNGGGAVLTLPYLAAFFTEDPTLLLRNSRSGSIGEYHYTVDLNRNGKFYEPEDTYAEKYNLFVLTSNFSFSCGNALPTMAKTSGVKIIGEQSGGGACAVKPFSDGCGTIFNTSNQNQIVYKDENGNYIHNDAGIPVDYPLSSDSWYDLTKLNAFVKNLTNN